MCVAMKLFTTLLTVPDSLRSENYALEYLKGKLYIQILNHAFGIFAWPYTGSEH